MNKILASALATGLLLTATTANALLFNGHDYQVVLLPGNSWNNATSHMISTLGSNYHLATVTTQAEQNFIQNTLLSGMSGEYWLGGYQAPLSTTSAGANWTWVTGETWNYTNWNSSEPNDAYGPGSEQHLAMWSQSGWKWNDEGNLGNMTGYIAENPIPEPTTLLLFGTGIAALAGLRLRKKR